MGYHRILEIDLPAGQSAFFWGARKTGKSTYLKKRFPHSIRYDFLELDTFLRLEQAPYEIRRDMLALSSHDLRHPVIIDEFQKIPILLNEIHWMIENIEGIHFILCGSSTRSLKKQHVNLLGGRAWRFELFPLVYPELPNFDLLHIFKQGLVPQHFSQTPQSAKRTMKAYILDYLINEVQVEARIRSLHAFTKFLDIVGISNGEMLNFSNIARDCGLSSKTIQSYFELLSDMLLGYFIMPFSKKVKRDLIKSVPKFYFFDVGISNFLGKKNILELKGADAGKSFEHFIFLELQAFHRYREIDYPITYWRTKEGLEVDFVLKNGEVAIEVKIIKKVNGDDLKGLAAFGSENPLSHLFLVCLVSKPQKIVFKNCNINVLPLETFLTRLWEDKLLIGA